MQTYKNTSPSVRTSGPGSSSRDSTQTHASVSHRDGLSLMLCSFLRVWRLRAGPGADPGAPAALLTQAWSCCLPPLGGESSGRRGERAPTSEITARETGNYGNRLLSRRTSPPRTLMPNKSLVARTFEPLVSHKSIDRNS